MTKDEVRGQIASTLCVWLMTDYCTHDCANTDGRACQIVLTTADRILAIPAIAEGLAAVKKGYNAKVYREAELPEKTLDEFSSSTGLGLSNQAQLARHEAYHQAQQDMLKAGWVKEVTE